MKLVKIAEYDNESERLTYPEAVKAAKKKGAELLTVEEWIDCGIQYGHPLYCCTPSWLKKTKGGLLARGYYLSSPSTGIPKRQKNEGLGETKSP